jgi:hypothetical protein
MRVLFAYLDPVTGSALVQVGLAAMAAVGLGYQYFRKGLQSTWSRLRGNDPGAEEPLEKADV